VRWGTPVSIAFEADLVTARARLIRGAAQGAGIAQRDGACLRVTLLHRAEAATTRTIRSALTRRIACVHLGDRAVEGLVAVRSPIPLRSLFAVHPELLAPVLQIIHRVIATHLIRQTGVKRREAATGAVTLIQRFGSAANLNIHLHPLVLDGIYHTGAEGAPVFHPAPALTGEELPALLDKIIARILRVLTRQGHLVEEEGVTYVADAHGIIDPENLLAPLQAASCTYRIAFGLRAGRKVLSWQYAARRAVPITQQLCTNVHGFSLHAGVRCAADQRQALEHLCRYITRTAIANERLSVNHAGQVVLKLKTPYRDGTSHIVMSPLEFMQRLAALVPRPRLHLIRFHGVLAPHARLRAAIVPIPAPPTTAHATDCEHAPGASARMSWARLLKRVFDIDIERCPRCGGNLKIIAAIEESAVIERILTHLGLCAQPPPRRPARLVDLFQAA
jgi:putative transposase